MYPDWAGIGAKDTRSNLLPGDSKFAQSVFGFGDLDNVDQHKGEGTDDAMMDDDAETLSKGSLVLDRWTKASKKCLEQVNLLRRTM